MKNLNRKPGRNAGFTLVEMLIVVAIIAILVAVSIPMVSSSLERSRDNTDKANERAAKAAATMVYLGAAKITDKDGKEVTTGTFYYDAEAGKLVPEGSDDVSKIEPYGKCSKVHDDGTTFGSSGEDTGDHTADGHGIIVVNISAKGEITVEWDEDYTGPEPEIKDDLSRDDRVDNLDKETSKFPEWYEGLLKEQGPSNNSHTDIYMAVRHLSEKDFNDFVAAYDKFYEDFDKLEEEQKNLTDPNSEGYNLAVAFVDKWRGALNDGIKAANAAGETSQSGVQHHELWEALGGEEQYISEDLKNRSENKWS